MRNSNAGTVPALHRIEERHARAERGQSVIELALVLPVLMAILVGAVDLGRVFYSQISLSDAARNGALAAAVDPTKYQPGSPCPTPPADPTPNKVMCAVTNSSGSAFVTIHPADVVMSCSTDGVTYVDITAATPSPGTCPHSSGARVRITVTAHFDPFVGPQFNLGSSAVAALTEAPPPPSPQPSNSAAPSASPSESAGPSPSSSTGPSPSQSASPPTCLAPTASFTWTPTTPKKKKDVVAFTDTSTNMPPGNCSTAWTWTFGDASGGSSPVQNPTYLYQSQGLYTVTLLVTNSAGTASVSHSITVTP